MPISERAPSLAQLRAFLAVAEFLHFRAAASSLGVTQPTLSAAIAACEEALGARLVERTTRRVMLTATGERLVPRARAVLDAMDALVTEVAVFGRPFTGRLRLGIIPTVAPYLLPVALPALRRAFPELEIEVHEERTAPLLDGATTGRLDLAVLALPVVDRNLAALLLYAEDFVLVTPKDHPLAERQVISRQALRDLDVLLLEEGHCLRDQALDVCREVGTGVETAARATSLTTLVQLVAAGMGVTLLPASAVSLETRRNQLRVSRFASPKPGRRIGVVYRDSAGREAEFTAIAHELRRAVRTRRMPVRLAPDRV
ncbi:hydrogen peroxide-inducible genes activator [Actinoalloteichus caeruleus]|uniref:hydrogen peroxide-inducible genes activator n=1 Tax=Actinoalloteichus cyanogriseus TaxID=2893586 RepID=UPI0004AA66A5|nr:hydrogen peroxide-inducible genes activator [Actinoalloteichus caeruleus]